VGKFIVNPRWNNAPFEIRAMYPDGRTDPGPFPMRFENTPPAEVWTNEELRNKWIAENEVPRLIEKK
jgi:hypothetical protein